MIYLLIPIFIFILFFNYDCDYYLPKWFLIFLTFISIQSFEIFQITKMGSFVYFYTLFSSALICLWTLPPYDKIDRNVKMALNHECMKTIIYQSTMVFIFLKINFDHIKVIFDYAIPVCSIASGIMSFFYIMNYCKKENTKIGQYYPGGNRGVNSTLTSFLAVASLFSSIPLLAILGFLFGSVCCFKCKGLSGILGLLAGCTVLFWSFPILYIPEALFIAFVVYDFKYKNKFIPVNFFSDSGRKTIYKDSFEMMKVLSKKTFGMGSGSYSCFSIVFGSNKIIQEKRTGRQMLFPWMHSDVLQFYIENGIVGSVLMIFFIFEILLKCYHVGNPTFFAFFSCFFVNAMFNFPVRLAPDCLIICFVLKYLFLN